MKVLFWCCISVIIIGACFAQDLPEVTKDEVDGPPIEDCVDGEVDLGIILDESGSIGSSNFNKALEFLQDLLSHTSIDSGSVRVSIIKFSKKARVVFRFKRYTNSRDIIDRIGKIKYNKGGTNTSGAFRLANQDIFTEENGDRLEVPDVILLFTDGISTIDRHLTIPEAQKHKDLGRAMFVLSIGEVSEDRGNEISDVASKPLNEYVLLLDRYSDLNKLKNAVFKKICPVLQKASVIKEGAQCYQNDQIVRKRCRVFQCIDGVFRRIGFYGCLYKGMCVEWGKVKEGLLYNQDCNNYKCFKMGSCEGDVCSQYENRPIMKGCYVNGVCLAEGVSWTCPVSCVTRQCIAGVETIIKRGCMDANGKCYNPGYQYKEHCMTYECSERQGKYKFRPVQTGCLYNDNKCYKSGDIITENCVDYQCGYDPESGDYKFTLKEEKCPYNDICISEGEVIKDNEACIIHKCIYNKVQKRYKLRETVFGCDTDEGCLHKGSSQKEDCLQYTCDSRGKMNLTAAGCYDLGKCQTVNSRWRKKGECAYHTCELLQNKDGSYYTESEIFLDCRNFVTGDCMKPGESFIDHCKTYTCQENGKLKLTKSKCEGNGRCHDIGEDWVNSEICKHYRCKADEDLGAVSFELNFGCVDENGKCYVPGSIKHDDNCCVKHKCHDDHKFRLEVCEFNDKCYNIGDKWVDNQDCLRMECVVDPLSGDAAIIEKPYGCVENGKCYKNGYIYEHTCQTYKCEAGVGFSIIKSECPYGDNCKAVNETWFDRKFCQKLRCFEDEDGNVDLETVTYGCRDEENKCLKHGKESEESCVKYYCDNKKMVPVNINCEYKGKCVPLNTVINDTDECVQYKCVQDKSGTDFVKTKFIETWGCLDQACYFSGMTKVDGCSTYRCRREKFRLIEPACEWNEQCYKPGDSWNNTRKCIKYSCIINEESGLPEVTQKVFGCKDRNGDCQRYGHRYSPQQCVEYECQRGADGTKYYPVVLGCPKNKDTCVEVGKRWVNYKQCVKKTCNYEEGDEAPTVSDSPYGCMRGNKCYKMGKIIEDEDNSCIKYRCTNNEIFTPVEFGCLFGKVCKNELDVWSNMKNCDAHRCLREDQSADKVVAKIETIPGCRKLDGSCTIKGGKVVKDCTTYICLPERNGLVVQSEECQWEGQCKPVNSTWFDKKTCTDYFCRQSPHCKEVTLEETTRGCQKDDECFVAGEKSKQDKCNVFICNDKSNFKLAKVGCEVNGKCRNVGEVWRENCVQYTCRKVSQGPGYVKTKVDYEHGCVGKDGSCVYMGDKKMLGCLEYKCAAGGIFKVSKFACTTEEGQCVQVGEMMYNDCINYTCSAESKSLEPAELACCYNGQRKEIGKKWFDKEKCVGYKCVYDPEESDVDIVERVAGCVIDGENCLRHSKNTSKNCVDYKCKNGRLEPLKKQCYWNEKCYNVGAKWTVGCTHYECKLVEQGPNFIDFGVRFYHGCRDADNNCYKIGDRITDDCCTVRECRRGGHFRRVASGCVNSNGYCKYGDEMRECELEEVPEEPAAPEPEGCYDQNNKLKPIGTVIVEDCITYKCLNGDDKVKFYPMKYACSYKDVCIPPNKPYLDDSSCNFYRCVITKNSNSTAGYSRTIEEEAGCKDSSGCYYNGQVWNDACVQKQCRVSNKGGIIRSLKGGCKELTTDKCHVRGCVWVEKYKNRCWRVACIIRKGEYTTKMDKACEDVYGYCHDIGTGGLEAMVNGKRLSDCVCKPKGRKNVQFKCPKNQKLVAKTFGNPIYNPFQPES